MQKIEAKEEKGEGKNREEERIKVKESRGEKFEKVKERRVAAQGAMR